MIHTRVAHRQATRAVSGNALFVGFYFDGSTLHTPKMPLEIELPL
jgi:hypothetical protein